MIPALVHQTWTSDVLPPKFAPLAETWRRFSPSWERTLWTDDMLLDFVFEHYREYFELYCSYPKAICRADAARYMLLHKFGGMYADIDVECLADLSSLADETRVVLCHEPPTHWPNHHRGQPFVLFNGTMASPPDHPFWLHVLEVMARNRHATDVLDLTGPFLLTGAYLSFNRQDSVAVHNCQLFTPTDRHDRESEPYGNSCPTPLTRHMWALTWHQEAPRRGAMRRRLTYYFRRWRHLRTRGPVLDPEETQARIDPAVLARPVPAGDRVSILVPVRDAVANLDGFAQAISALDLARETTKLVFCEGDSVDGTPERLQRLAVDLERRFAKVVLLKKDIGNTVPRERRSDRPLQRTRRAGLAVVRNHLIDHGLDETDDWALWIDVDVWKFPANIFQLLRQADARIVAPNCVIYPGGPTYDLNTFITTQTYGRDFYYRHLHDGLFQPPVRARGRLFPDCVRYSSRVELDGVGGTMLLVDASLHRGGLRFPELPYKDLIETEGLGALARDVGVPAIGLPQVEILHVPRG